MIDVAVLRDAARDRAGDVLAFLGAKVRGTAERGRATCPLHGGEALSVAYSAGMATCHSGCGGKTFDALGLLAEARGLDLRRAEDFRAAAGELAALLGVDPEADRPAPRIAPRREPAPAPPPERDAAALWAAMALHDDAGETYLEGRGLLLDPLPGELVRFNTGHSGDSWVDARAQQGFRAAFPVRDVRGTVRSLVFRHVGPGAPPETFGKAPSLKGCPLAGAAICLPEVVLLGTHDPEFERDEVLICEGPTSTLAALQLFRDGNEELPMRWPLGAIGRSAAPGVVRAFGNVIRWRRLHIALDTDAAGEEMVKPTAEAAREVGAREVRRMRPTVGKDLADAVQAAAGGARAA